MKLHTELNPVERGGVKSENTFRIKTTAKAFDILSSGLYTDPKLAVIRELSCNALDAHVAAGRGLEPFEIHLPNKLEPWFHVRDFGTGLSDEDIQGRLVTANINGVDVTERQGGLYTTYFDSTKADSNDFIGALGLGSKSPFSYTKAFEVISRFNGEQRMYSIFINEDGLPSVALLGCVKTKEGNGLEVRITVQKEDFDSYAEKTARALRWFTIKPNVVGWPRPFSFMEVPKERVEGKNWKLFESNFVNDYSKMTAVQGNVAYKVDISKLPIHASDVKLLENAHIVGFFSIGELEVAANREEIRYDDRSKAALVARIADMRAGVLASVEKQVEEMKGKSFWEIVIDLNALAQKIFNDKSLFKQFVKDTKNEVLQRYMKSGGSFEITSMRGHVMSGYTQTYSNGGRAVSRKNVGSGVTPEPNVVIFYNDLPSGGIARVMEYVRKHRGNFPNGKQVMALVIRPEKSCQDISYDKTDSNKIVTKRDWVEADFLKELKQLHEELGNVPLLLTSKDAPVPPRALVQKTDLPIFKFGGLKGKYNQYITWNRQTAMNLEDGGLWFNLENGARVAFIDKKNELKQVQWRLGDVSNNFDEAIRLVNEYLDTEYTRENLFGFGSQAVNKIKKNEKWINIFDVLREVGKSYVEAEGHFATMDATPDAHGVKAKVLKTTRGKFFDEIRAMKKTSEFRLAIEPMIEGHEKYGKLDKTIKFVRQINIDLQLGLFDNKGSKYYDGKAFQGYPMFKFISNIDYNTDRDLEVLFEYINLIDRS